MIRFSLPPVSLAAIGGGLMVAVVIVVLVVLLIRYCVRIVPQSHTYVIERLGTYSRTMQPGLNIVLPFFDRIVRKVTMMEIVQDFKPQPCITKDNVTILVDTVVYSQIMDPKLFCYGIQNPDAAIENLCSTTLRNIVGGLELDEALTSRDFINSRIREELDEATDAWGIKIKRVEIKNLEPPREIQAAMEKQMKAEREKREMILRAEGERQSAVLTAQGQKEAAILNAEAEKASKILAAEASKEAQIREAEGQAQAIRDIYEAQVFGINQINQASPDPAYLQLEALKALEKVADGRATKLIIPSELQNLSGLLASAQAVLSPAPDGSPAE
ncbi:MAG: SPFH/Band 7/PHB domain protein [Oscillospiraceae bacterium]|nr:SPFH/Band 7/PHB domain protein [Oscillospiraceae bacterium]MDD4367329.1 SPFH/Band 7/PHB domain protein [Oscillospiraceae bacterium]